MKRTKPINAFIFLLSLVFFSYTASVQNDVYAQGLSAPSNFKARAYQYSVYISWINTNQLFTHTIIEKSTDGGEFYPIANVQSGLSSYSDTSVSNGHVYTYRARVVHEAMESSYTPEVEAIVLYPVDFSISYVYSNQVDLTWSYPTLPLARTPDYQTLIERRAQDEYAWTQIAALPFGETTYRDTQVSPATYYYYRIRTKYSHNEYSRYYPYDHGISARSAYPLTTPLWGNAISERTIKLEWDMSLAANGRIIIQKKDAQGNFKNFFITDTSSSCVDVGLAEGETYTYRLYAQSLSGVDSEYSAEINVTTELVPSPSDLKVSALSPGQIALTWEYPHEGESGFEIWRKGDELWELIAQVPKNTLSYSDYGSENQKQYTYKVRAVRGDTAFSAFSQSQTVINLFPETPKPLVCFIDGIYLRIFSRDPVPRNTTYTLEYRSDLNSVWKDYKTVAKGTLSAYFVYSANSEYYFRLRANSDTLESFGPEYHFYGSVPEPPQSLKAQVTGFNRVLLTWDDVTSKEDGYHIYRTANGKRELIGYTEADAESFTDIAPAAGSASVYEVAAYNVTGQSETLKITVNVPSRISFKDVDSYTWAHSAIYSLLGLGALGNPENGYFYPESSLSRGQLAFMTIRSFNIPYDTNTLLTITDLKPDHKYNKELVTAAKLGLLHPDAQGMIYPDKSVTRRDIILFLNNALGAKGIGLNSHEPEILQKFNDYHLISPDEKNIIASFVGEGIISGRTGQVLGLSSDAAKVEAVAFIYRTMLKYGLLK